MIKNYYIYKIEKYNEEYNMWEYVNSYITYIDAKLNFERINNNCIGIYRFIKIIDFKD